MTCNRKNIPKQDPNSPSGGFHETRCFRGTRRFHRPIRQHTGGCASPAQIMDACARESRKRRASLSTYAPTSSFGPNIYLALVYATVTQAGLLTRCRVTAHFTFSTGYAALLRSNAAPANTRVSWVLPLTSSLASSSFLSWSVLTREFLFFRTVYYLFCSLIYIRLSVYASLYFTR